MTAREPDLAGIAATVQRLAVLLSAGVTPVSAWGYLGGGGLPDEVAVACRDGGAIPDAIVLAASRTAVSGERDAWRGVAAAWVFAT